MGNEWRTHLRGFAPGHHNQGWKPGYLALHCKKFWVIALPNFGQMYALPKKNGQKPNFFWV